MHKPTMSTLCKRAAQPAPCVPSLQMSLYIVMTTRSDWPAAMATPLLCHLQTHKYLHLLCSGSKLTSTCQAGSASYSQPSASMISRTICCLAHRSSAHRLATKKIDWPPAEQCAACSVTDNLQGRCARLSRPTSDVAGSAVTMASHACTQSLVLLDVSMMPVMSGPALTQYTLAASAPSTRPAHRKGSLLCGQRSRSPDSSFWNSCQLARFVRCCHDAQASRVSMHRHPLGTCTCTGRALESIMGAAGALHTPCRQHTWPIEVYWNSSALSPKLWLFPARA